MERECAQPHSKRCDTRGWSSDCGSRCRRRTTDTLLNKTHPKKMFANNFAPLQFSLTGAAMSDTSDAQALKSDTF